MNETLRDGGFGDNVWANADYGLGTFDVDLLPPFGNIGPWQLGNTSERVVKLASVLVPYMPHTKLGNTETLMMIYNATLPRFDPRCPEYNDHMPISTGESVRWTITLEDIASHIAQRQVTYERHLVIRGLPQKGKEWHDERYGRGTGSNFHNIMTGKCGEIVFKEFQGNDATRYGTVREEFGRDVWIADFLSKERRIYPNVCVDVYDYGLEVPFKECSDGWGIFGLSTDGEIHIQRTPQEKAEDQVLTMEIKCPYGSGQEGKSKQRYYEIPEKYFAQIQGSLGFKKRLDGEYVAKECVFINWTPDGTSVRHYDFSPSYFFNELRPNLCAGFFFQYIPLFEWLHRGIMRKRAKVFTPVLKIDSNNLSAFMSTSADDTTYNPETTMSDQNTTHAAAMELA